MDLSRLFQRSVRQCGDLPALACGAGKVLKGEIRMRKLVATRPAYATSRAITPGST